MIAEGLRSFTFSDPAVAGRGTIEVFTYRAPTHDRSSPVIVLLHGSDRAAAYFRDCWIAHADRMGALLLAPRFDQEAFPGVDGYNYGSVLGEGRAARPQPEWAYGLIDRLFAYVRTGMGLERSGFWLFGHSAGAQFAHRYFALVDAPLAEAVVTGNAGWYMLPDAELEFPAGTGGVSAGYVERYLSRRLVILLGDADVDPNDPGLPREPAAVAQGSTRLARGLFYFDHCKALAAKLGVGFGWRLVVAPRVGHRDDEIATPAAEALTALAASIS